MGEKVNVGDHLVVMVYPDGLEIPILNIAFADGYAVCRSHFRLLGEVEDLQGDVENPWRLLVHFEANDLCPHGAGVAAAQIEFESTLDATAFKLRWHG